MDLKSGVIIGTVITLSVALAIILAEKYQQKQIAKSKAATQNG
ncbi:MAG: hypothetical protein AAF242_02720 [Bacteroidota bacterium]